MIIERIKTILSHFNLSPSAFADTIGVPRSSISHLLSGRNKPSLDFVLKLVDTFPEIDLYWLLHGKGQFPSMQDVSSEANTVAHVPHSPDKNTNSPPLPFDDRKISKIVVFYEDATFETYRPKK